VLVVLGVKFWRQKVSSQAASFQWQAQHHANLKKIALCLNQIADAMQEWGGPVRQTWPGDCGVLVLTSVVPFAKVVHRVDIIENPLLMKASPIGGLLLQQDGRRIPDTPPGAETGDFNALFLSKVMSKHDDAIVQLLHGGTIEQTQSILPGIDLILCEREVFLI
jgi:hypothetical protein